MPLTLSGADLRALTRASTVLASPFDFGTVDAWRSTVNRELRDLLGADSVGFLLPESGGLYLYSEEHDPAALARYPDLTPPDLRDGRNIFETMASGGVNTLERTYGEDFDLYLGSEYYNDYAGANGAHDTLAAMLPVHEAGAAGVQLWHEHPRRRKFGDREVVMLSLLYPAVRAGILGHLQFGRYAHHLTSVIDQLDQAVLVLDADGAVVHQTSRLAALLAADVEPATILGAALRAAVSPGIACVGTAAARYALRRLRCESLGARPLTLVVVERVEYPSQTGEERAMTALGLTDAERKVAREIVRGRSNKEIAATLSISPHTVKRHTERVFAKLGVARRDQVGARLRQ